MEELAQTPAPRPDSEESRPAAPAARCNGLPAGYRQGVITAITVLIGFSLSFICYWAFEAPGEWTMRSVVALIAGAGHPGLLHLPEVQGDPARIARAPSLQPPWRSQVLRPVRPMHGS
jgi:hypothetical protein